MTEQAIQPDGLDETALDMAFDPDYVVCPGATLQDWLEEHETSKQAFMKACGFMPKRYLDGVLDGSMKISEGLAQSLEQGTGIPAGMWLKRDSTFRKGLKQGKTWVK